MVSLMSGKETSTVKVIEVSPKLHTIQLQI